MMVRGEIQSDFSVLFQFKFTQTKICFCFLSTADKVSVGGVTVSGRSSSGWVFFVFKVF